jgi:nitric oxide reductase activation protein
MSMSHEDFSEQLGRLMSEAHAADPQATAQQAQHLSREAQERQEKLRRTVNTLQDSLDQLRLSVKYLVFDLEATRRENRYLRKLLSGDGEAASD